MYDFITQGFQIGTSDDSFIKRNVTLDDNVLLLLINTILAHITMTAIDESAELADEIFGVLPIFGVRFGNGRIVNSFGNKEDADLEGLVKRVFFNSDTSRPRAEKEAKAAVEEKEKQSAC